MPDEMNTSTTPSLPADDTQALPASDLPELEAGDEVEVELEAGDYEVLVGEQGPDATDVAKAEEFGETLVATQNLINRYSQQFDDIKEKMKHLRESLKNIFENDVELQELEAKAKTVTQDLTQKKARVKESPEAVQLQMKIKEMTEEKKEIEESLNNFLLRYYQMTGSQVIEEADGTEREFSVRASLRGKKKAE